MKKINGDLFFTKKQNVFVLALLCAALWGSAYPGVKTGYELFHVNGDDTSSTILFAGIRFIIAGILTILFFCAVHKKFIFPDRKDRKGIILTGFIQTSIQYTFFYIGVAHLSGVKSSILGATITFFSVFLAHFMFQNDKLDKKKIAGCLFGFTGIIFVNSGKSGFFESFTLSGDGCMLLSAFAAALGALISKKAAVNSSPIMVAGYQMTFGGLLLFLTGMVMGGNIDIDSFMPFLLLFYLSLVSAVAFALWTTLLKYNKSGTITIYNFLIPVFGTGLSALFLGEPIITYRNLAALIFVCLGIYTVHT